MPLCVNLCCIPWVSYCTVLWTAKHPTRPETSYPSHAVTTRLAFLASFSAGGIYAGALLFVLQYYHVVLSGSANTRTVYCTVYNICILLYCKCSIKLSVFWEWTQCNFHTVRSWTWCLLSSDPQCQWQFIGTKTALRGQTYWPGIRAHCSLIDVWQSLIH